MKKTKNYLGLIVMLALLVTSCSKDEQTPVSDSEMGTLSFNAIVQDLANKAGNKQVVGADEIPACSDDEAAYVEIVLMQGAVEVVGSESDPYRVDLVAGEVFTEEDAELELTPGTYSLDHFSVYNSDGDLLWVAPRAGSALAEFVDTTLPVNINLGAGVKKYVDVPVLCYDDRDINEYGYQFFELDMTEMYEFCFFANYCAPEGRHYPARIAVEVEIDGTVVFTGESTVGTDNNGDFFAEPVCFSVPDLPDYDLNEEYVDYTVTLLSWDENYGEVTTVAETGSLSRAEIIANHRGSDDVEYEHLRFGCGDDGEQPVDSDNDGVVDSIDECPNTEAGVEVNNVGCPVADTDSDEDGVVDSIDECPGTAAGVEVDNVGCPVQETDSDGDGVVDSIDECPDTPTGVEVDAVGCPIDTDNDDVPDYLDECDNQAGPVTNDGCPVATAECIPAPATECNTSEAFAFTLEEAFQLFQFDYGDITITINESNDLAVGITPIAPWNLTDLQIYFPSTDSYYCFDTTEPAEGIFGTIEGDFAGDVPLNFEVKVNYCNVGAE